MVTSLPLPIEPVKLIAQAEDEEPLKTEMMLLVMVTSPPVPMSANVIPQIP
jgi:hypothetical protein